IGPEIHLTVTSDGNPKMLVQVARDYRSATEARYINGYITDTVSFNRLTVNGGIRFDYQKSSLTAASVPGVTGFETILPTLSTPAVDGVYIWDSLTPRVGFTYAVGDTRK